MVRDARCADHRKSLNWFHPRPAGVARRMHAFCSSPLPLKSGPFLPRLQTRPCSARRPQFDLAPCVTVSALKDIAEGHLLQFQHNGKRRLGRVVRPDGKRNWIVEDANGVTSSVSPKQVVYTLDSTAVPEEIGDFELTCHSLASDSSDLLEVAWEIVSNGEGVDGTNVATVSHIADLIFDDRSPESLFATFILLSKDTVFFKERVIKGENVYEARKSDLVENVRAQQRIADAKENERIVRRASILKAYDDGELEAFKSLLSPDDETFLSCLEAMAVELDTGSRVDERYPSNRVSAFQEMPQAEQELVRETLSILGLPVLPSSAMCVLVSFRLFSRHENLSLRRCDLLDRRSFSNRVMDAANDLASTPVEDMDRNQRINLCHLLSFAIDSEDTSEVDDAISWDPDLDRILVHVADPTRYFPDGPQNPIVEEAMRRGATLYLPHEKITMFPDVLAGGIFSLDGTQADGSALTFGFRIRDDGSIDEDSCSVHPTLISSPIRLTYEAADEILLDTAHEYHATLQTTLQKATDRREWRLNEGGAIMINNPFADVRVQDVDSDDPRIDLGVTETDGKSWTLVSELMISACNVAALVGEKAKLPLPFRGQEPFDYPPDEVLEAVPDGPARAALVFRNATSSEVKTEPIEHASLGLDSYVQVTSPIRRGLDLVTHFQMKAHLRGDDLPYSVDDLNREIGRNTIMGKTIRGVENRSKKYWQIEYLRRLGPSVLHRATYVKRLGESSKQVGVFHLDDYGMQVIAQSGIKLALGATAEIRVTTADPRTGQIRAECVGKSSCPTVVELDELLDDVLSDVTTGFDSDSDSASDPDSDPDPDS